MKSVGFFDAVKLAFSHYADFNGRATRSEYWYFYLFNILVTALLTSVMPPLSGIWALATLVPGLSVAVRRLHDVGKKGSYCWWVLLPVAGWVMLILQLCKESTEDNQWGPKC